MIKRLRLRFILASLIAVLVVLTAAIASIDIYNYVGIQNEAKESLVLVVDQEAGYADPEPYSYDPTQYSYDPGMYSYDPANPGQGQGGNPGGQGGGGGWGWPGMDDYERLMREHYFVVSFDLDGNINYSDFMHVFSISQEEGEALATDIYKNGTKGGMVKDFRYTREKRKDNTYIAFIDIHERLNSYYDFVKSSVGISAVGYAVVAGLIVLAAFFVFRTNEESYRKQKAFITNASHELKTPLTIINTDLEIIEMDNGKNEWTESIHDQVNRLTSMTNQLVILSKLDENDLKNYPFEDFSLTKLSNECIEAFLPTYQKNNYTFAKNIEENLGMHGNRYLINELFYIFLDNALKYTKPNGEVGVRVSRTNKRISIIFYNDIVENHQIDTNQLFERFYRSPNANKKEGSGIGLSIAKEIVELHKGKISANIKDNKIIFTIIL